MNTGRVQSSIEFAIQKGPSFFDNRSLFHRFGGTELLSHTHASSCPGLTKTELVRPSKQHSKAPHHPPPPPPPRPPPLTIARPPSSSLTLLYLILPYPTHRYSTLLHLPPTFISASTSTSTSASISITISISTPTASFLRSSFYLPSPTSTIEALLWLSHL